MNNFQRLQQLQEEKFLLRAQDPLRDNLFNSLRTFRFIGQVVDLYLPRVVDVIVSASSGQIGDEALSVAYEKRRSSDPASGHDGQRPAMPGPRMPPA